MERRFYIALNHIAAFKPLDFPLLAATETGLPQTGNWVGFLFRNAPQPYAVPNILVNTHHISEHVFRSSHLRSPGRIENSFANESSRTSWRPRRVDPAEFRLKHLSDPRGSGVFRAAMKLSGWQSRPSPSATQSGAIAKGRGIAYTRYNGTITYVAAVADVEVNRAPARCA